ncbi:MAG: hypothetical protein AAFX50_00960, partial [Acidobacteriota bacterium]
MSAEPNVPPDSGDQSLAAEAAESRRRRRFRRLGAGAIGVLVALAAVLGVLLGTARGQRALFDSAAERIHGSTGWLLSAQDVDLHLRSGRLTLGGVTVGDAAAAPVLRVDKLAADLDLSRLRGGEVALESVEIFGPVVDLAAPIPAPPTDGEPEPGPAEPGAGPPDVSTWRLEGGAIENGPGGGWLASFAAAGLEAEGSVIDGAMELGIRSVELTLERAADGHRLLAEASGRVRGPLAGPFTLDHLQVLGDALELRASGTLGVSDDQPLRVAVAGRLDPALLAPEIAAGAGLVSVDGGVDVPGDEAWAKIDAREFPPRILEPFLDPAAMEWLEPVERLDLVADLRASTLGPDGVGGDATLTLRGGGEVLATGAATLGDEDGGARSVLEIEAALLPASEGFFRGRGQLLFADWRDLSGGRLRRATLDAEKADLGAFARRLGSLWPRIDAAVASVPAGRARAEISLSGPLMRPRLDGAAALETRDGGTLEAELAGDLGAPSIRLQLADLDPAVFASIPPPATGRWRGTVELDGGAPRAPLRIALEASSVDASDLLRASGVAVDGELSMPWRDGRPRLDEPVTGAMAVAIDALVAPDLAPEGLELTSIAASAEIDGVLGAGLLRDGLALASDVDVLRSGPATLSGLDLDAVTEAGALRIDGLSAALTAPGLEALPIRLAGRVDLGGESPGDGARTADGVEG